MSEYLQGFATGGGWGLCTGLAITLIVVLRLGRPRFTLGPPPAASAQGDDTTAYPFGRKVA